MTSQEVMVDGSSVRVYEEGSHAIYHGDALVVLGSCIPDGSVDLVFADPPYNIGKRFGEFVDKWPSDREYAEWCYRWLKLCIAKLRPYGSMYVMTSTQCMPYLDLYLRERLTILSRIVWYYDSSGVQAQRLFGSMYEPMLLCVKDGNNYTFNADDIKVEAKTGSQRKLIDYRKPTPAPYNSHKVPGNVWEIPRVRYKMREYEEHPSQKPEALLERIVRASSSPGDTVLDPFAGTFTASAVAQRLGRCSAAVELNEEYVRIGLRRLKFAMSHNGSPLAPPRKACARRAQETESTLPWFVEWNTSLPQR